jgi:hypothetical protein
MVGGRCYISPIYDITCVASPYSSTIVSRHVEKGRWDPEEKNAIFDIPAERNLNNIDQLIANSTDEQEIKELKMQKRLLRNRQAA